MPRTTKRKTAAKNQVKETTVLRISQHKTSALPSTSMSPAQKTRWQRLALLTLILIGLAFFALKYRYLLVSATVNGSPIFSWRYARSLHQNSGNQTINQMVVERLIELEAAKNGVVVSDDELNAELSKLETQFTASGGLDTFLQAQGITRDEVKKQLTLTLSLEKLVADQLAITDEEVDSYYQENQETYKEKSAEEAKSEIKELLGGQKRQQTMGEWLEQAKSQANIKFYLPGTSLL